jgi:hypothetical protein
MFAAIGFPCPAGCYLPAIAVRRDSDSRLESITRLDCGARG